MDYKIFWTDEAINNLEEILDYLNKEWTQREVDNFKIKLSKQIDIINRFPKIFPISNFNPRLRKAVLSKQTTIFFELKSRMIIIAYIFVNKRDIDYVK